MMRCCVWLAVLALSIGCAAIRESGGSPLAVPRTFSFGGTGYSGAISPGETAFVETLRSSNAEATFLAAAKSGNPQGKCYGLVGLRRIHSSQFNPEAAKLGSRTEVVTLLQGCVMSSKPLGEIVGEIYAGKYDDLPSLPPGL